MTLGTHAVVGGAIGLLAASHPALALIGGFASHFVLDAIPHWDYHLASAEKNFRFGREFVGDLAKIALDFGSGLLIIWLILNQGGETALLSVWLGAIGGVLPDALQLAYFKLRWRPLVALQYFHTDLVHTGHRLKHQRLLGISSQLAIIFLVSWLMLR